MGKGNNDKPSSTQTQGNNTPSNRPGARTPTTETENRGPSTDTSQGSPLAVVVELPGSEAAPAAEDGGKKRKQRPKGLTYNKGGKAAAKSTAAPSIETQIIMSTLVSGMFGIAATRLGPHWSLTPDETQAIATPATNIMSRMVDSEKLDKYSDGAALVIALSMALIPRVVISKSTPEKQKESNVHPIQRQPKEGGASDAPRQNPKTATSSGNDVRSTGTPDSQSNVKAFLESVSSQGY